MEQIISGNIVNLLSVSMILSAIVMLMIQKCKQFFPITKNYQIGILNVVLSFSFGIPFAMYFYSYSLIEACWIGLFSVIGAPSIYDILKNQLITEETKTDTIIEEIKRDE